MGKRGPQPKPNVLKIIEGNPGKRKVTAPGIVATGEPFIPDDLHDHAIECIEMIKEMMPPKTYAKVDGFALSAYATAYAWHRHCRHAMNANDFQPIVKGSTGADRPNPYFKLLQTQSDQMRSWGTRLGLDPAARQSMMGGGPLAPERPVSKFDQLRGGLGK